MKYRYTEAERKKLLENLVVQVDSREQENKHITDFFTAKKIKFEKKSLESGDYSFYITECPELGINHEWWCDNLFIERKASLDELAGNLKEERFFNEVKRTLNIKQKFLIIESCSWEDIINHKYMSQYSEKAFYSQLIKLMTKYDIKIIFTKRSGAMIYQICRWVIEEEIMK